MPHRRESHSDHSQGYEQKQRQSSTPKLESYLPRNNHKHTAGLSPLGVTNRLPLRTLS